MSAAIIIYNYNTHLRTIFALVGSSIIYNPELQMLSFSLLELCCIASWVVFYFLIINYNFETPWGERSENKEADTISRSSYLGGCYFERCMVVKCSYLNCNYQRRLNKWDASIVFFLCTHLKDFRTTLHQLDTRALYKIKPKLVISPNYKSKQLYGVVNTIG